MSLIDREAAIDALADYIHNVDKVYGTGHLSMSDCEDAARSVIDDLPSAQPERYTKEELRVFQHGISLSLLSKRSAQHWRYDEDTATEIKFLERLHEKVGADMRGEQDDSI